MPSRKVCLDWLFLAEIFDGCGSLHLLRGCSGDPWPLQTEKPGHEAM